MKKETYYKLNREKLESAENRWEQSIIEHLIKRSFLEEVQEEEMFSDGDNTPEEEKYSSHLFKAMTEWHLMEYISRSSSSKYVDKELIRACQKELHRRSKEVQNTKEELPYTEEIQNRKLQEGSKQAIDNMFGNPLEQVDNMIEGTKPFLDGMTPSDYMYEGLSVEDLQDSQIVMGEVSLFLNLLVEELKRKGSL